MRTIVPFPVIIDCFSTIQWRHDNHAHVTEKTRTPNLGLKCSTAKSLSWADSHVIRRFPFSMTSKDLLFLLPESCGTTLSYQLSSKTISLICTSYPWNQIASSSTTWNFARDVDYCHKSRQTLWNTQHPHLRRCVSSVRHESVITMPSSSDSQSSMIVALSLHHDTRWTSISKKTKNRWVLIQSHDALNVSDLKVIVVVSIDVGNSSVDLRSDIVPFARFSAIDMLFSSWYFHNSYNLCIFNKHFIFDSVCSITFRNYETPSTGYLRQSLYVWMSSWKRSLLNFSFFSS